MSINRIKRLQNFGVFHDFQWPDALPDFGKYNLIYGWNGSGKTTLSKLFRHLECRTAPALGQVNLTIAGRDVRNDDFTDSVLPVRVFNRDFVGESVFPIGGEVAPIFILGKQNVEKQKKVEEHKAMLAEMRPKLAPKRQEKTDAEAALEKLCSDRARDIKRMLRAGGAHNYHDYDKRNFRQRAEAMVSVGDRDAHALDDTERTRLLSQLPEIPKPPLQPLKYQSPAFGMLADTAANLLSTSVVSAAIQSLKDDSVLSPWVHAGLRLHKERDGAKCLFCDQPMPDGRLGALQAHFSTQYEDLLQKLDDEINAIKSAIEAGTALEQTLPKSSDVYDDLSPKCDSASAGIRREVKSARQFLEVLSRALNDKKKRVFENVLLDVVAPASKDAIMGGLNEVILTHNKRCDDFESSICSARRRLEADSVAEALEDFVGLGATVQATERAVATLNGEVNRLSDEIARLEDEIHEHRQPAEELNEDLRAYLGHSEIYLDVEENGYTIMRHGVPAQALSEGETTAIALLYFLRSLNDRRAKLEDIVVVLDDPVSSLDANALYFAFALIKERTQHARQLIILTHNFTFFRQVRNWFDHVNGWKRKKPANQRPARFYMVECTHEQNRRRAAIRWLDPLLEEYDSEYHYLFARIYRVVQSSPQTALEKNYALPNLARRLLEVFLTFRQPQFSGNLWQQLQGVQFDEAKKTRILRFLHTHSHGSALGEPEHDLSLLSEGNSILTDLMNMIQTVDREHFEAMVSLVKQEDTVAG